MLDLSIVFNDQEKMIIAEEIGKLFDLHDRPLKEEKRLFFLEEIVRCGYPLPSILAGLRKLMVEDITRISLNAILVAIEQSTEKTVFVKENCDDCLSLGLILLRDDRQYEFALSCICKNGDQFYGNGYVRWNGENIQFNKGRRLSRKLF